MANRFAVGKNKKETETENVWQRRTEMKVVPGEKGDEDNRVYLYYKMKRAKDHVLALRPRVVVQSMSIKLNFLMSPKCSHAICVLGMVPDLR